MQPLKGHLVMSVEFVLKVGYASQPADIFYSLLPVAPKEFPGDIGPGGLKVVLGIVSKPTACEGGSIQD